VEWSIALRFGATYCQFGEHAGAQLYRVFLVHRNTRHAYDRVAALGRELIDDAEGALVQRAFQTTWPDVRVTGMAYFRVCYAGPLRSADRGVIFCGGFAAVLFRALTGVPSAPASRVSPD
jgi:hypothetical protein